MKTQRILLSFTLLFLLVACGTSTPEPAITIPVTATSTQVPTEIPTVATITALPLTPDAPSIVEAPTETPTLVPDAWKNMPIIPIVPSRMVDVYRAGLAAGRDPTHFSKIGDCQNINTYFLDSFDTPKEYRLGMQYTYLQSTIDQFSGSWSRVSLAVKGGLNVAAALNPLWADPHQCKAGETPVACEIRVYNPSIVTVSMEESWSGDTVHYNMYLRKIVEYILSQNVVPILATRAELPGNDKDINATVARIAYDYQVPLWNFWAATNPLPSHGVYVTDPYGRPDGFHLTQGRYFFTFDDPDTMKDGWPWRNLTALEAIDAVYHAVSAQK